MRAVKRIGLGLLVVLVLAGGIAWTQRERLSLWWTLHGLSRADEAARGPWLDRLTAQGDAVVEPLLGHLVDGGERGAGNALAALDHLVRQQALGDDTPAALLARLGRVQPRLTAARQGQVLTVVAGWMNAEEVSAETVARAARLLEHPASDAEAQAAALELAAALLPLANAEAALPAIRPVALAGLRSEATAVRLRAVPLCLHAQVGGLDQVAGLLRDPSVEVRRAAILAVGPAEQVREEALLVGLHDSDAEVRRLTEVSLRSRGLRPEHLELGRLISHPQPISRLRVLDHLTEVLENQQGSEGDIDPGLWLRRLSHDGSPAVRAAALRLMSEQSLLDLSDRIDQMARSDPNPSVSQLAQYYLTRKRPSAARE